MTGRALLTLAVAALLGGCKSLYFQPAVEPAGPPPRYRLAEWPDREYWMGIIFTGQKIGFSHLSLQAASEPGIFEISSDAAFVLRFLGFDKRVNLKAYDRVREDLQLVQFRYEYVIDGSAVALAGERRGDVLEVAVTHDGQIEKQSLPVQRPVYPQAAVALYPTLAGLAPGGEFRYLVYSGELQKIAEVTQRITAYESSKLFSGQAFRVETAMEGYRVETWLSPRGAPLLEIGMNGVLISGLEDETRARNYLASASLNKAEALVEFALVRPERPLAAPRTVTLLKIALAGAARLVPSDDVQQCTNEGAETICTVHPADATRAATQTPPATDPRYLASSFPVPARDPRIVATARTIADGASDAREKVQRLVAWIKQNVRTSPVDVWTGADVLDTREAECQGHTYLYAAFARSLGIPTRVVNGIVYSEDFDGFLYHTWAESFVADRWLAVEPTFGTVPADATHVVLVEGETLAELAPLVDWIGRLRVRVIDVERAPAPPL